jgi:membrane protein YdbS with pleckstrin-like domain
VRPGERLERFKPSPALLQYRKVFFWIGLTVADLVLLILWVASFAIHPAVGAILLPFVLVLVVLPEVIAYIAIHLRYDTTWYVLSDRSVRIRHGIWIISETTITFENVQDVKIDQGPVQRYFGISDIIIQTAGGGSGRPSAHGETTSSTHVGNIEGVSDAHRIRDLIMNRVRKSRSAGLGDEHLSPSHHAPQAPAWTPAHLQVLREICEGLTRLRTSL